MAVVPFRNKNDYFMSPWFGSMKFGFFAVVVCLCLFYNRLWFRNCFESQKILWTFAQCWDCEILCELSKSCKIHFAFRYGYELVRWGGGQENSKVEVESLWIADKPKKCSSFKTTMKLTHTMTQKYKNSCRYLELYIIKFVYGKLIVNVILNLIKKVKLKWLSLSLGISEKFLVLQFVFNAVLVILATI